MGLAETWDHYWYQLADERIKDMVLMRSPIIIPAIILSYLYFVLKCGPEYMKNRKPYDLITFIKYYNVFQIIANLYIVTKLASVGVASIEVLICSPVDYSYTPDALEIVYTSTFTVIVKLIDLIETAIFVLRKRQRQISFLHLYHHVSTPLIGWILVRYFAVKMAMFTPLINGGVHVIMYTYYTLSTTRHKNSKWLKSMKPYITIIQMIQFVILLFQCVMSLLPSCPVNKFPGIFFSFNLIINLALFYNFYKQNYKSKRNNQQKKSN